MPARDRAEALSKQGRADRVDKAANRQELDAEEPKTFTYEGHDPKTGMSLIRGTGSCCCPSTTTSSSGTPIPSNTTATGRSISTTSFRKGEVVMARETEGDTRIDRVPGTEELEIEEIDEQPRAGEPVEPMTDCEGCVGFAYVYRQYTGEINDDGTYEVETVRLQNDSRCFSPQNPNRPLEAQDLGCGKAPLGRCQWYEVTEDFEPPEGMFISGVKPGACNKSYALCCTEDCSPATVAGIPYDEWTLEVATESGTAAIDTDYCAGSFKADLLFPEAIATSLSPPIRYEYRGFTHTWDLPSGCTGATEHFTEEEVTSFSLTPGAGGGGLQSLTLTNTDGFLPVCQSGNDSFVRLFGVDYPSFSGTLYLFGADFVFPAAEDVIEIFDEIGSYERITVPASEMTYAPETIAAVQNRDYSSTGEIFFLYDGGAAQTPTRTNDTLSYAIFSARLQYGDQFYDAPAGKTITGFTTEEYSEAPDPNKNILFNPNDLVGNDDEFNPDDNVWLSGTEWETNTYTTFLIEYVRANPDPAFDYPNYVTGGDYYQFAGLASESGVFTLSTSGVCTAANTPGGSSGVFPGELNEAFHLFLTDGGSALYTQDVFDSYGRNLTQQVVRNRRRLRQDASIGQSRSYDGVSGLPPGSLGRANADNDGIGTILKVGVQCGVHISTDDPNQEPYVFGVGTEADPADPFWQTLESRVFPAIRFGERSCRITVNFNDGTSHEILIEDELCPATIQRIFNNIKVSSPDAGVLDDIRHTDDISGVQVRRDAGTYSVNLEYSCDGAPEPSGYTLTFQPQGDSFEFEGDCEPTNVTINQITDSTTVSVLDSSGSVSSGLAVPESVCYVCRSNTKIC